MNLRCKHGDLAIITQEEAGCEANIGKFVMVHGPMRYDSEQGAVWFIVPVSKTPMTYQYSGRLHTEVYSLKDEIRHPDTWMIPIRPDAQIAEKEEQAMKVKSPEFALSEELPPAKCLATQLQLRF